MTIRLQVFFPEDPTVGGDVPHEATMQMTTIGGRPEFVDVERELCSVVGLVLVAQRDGNPNKKRSRT